MEFARDGGDTNMCASKFQPVNGSDDDRISALLIWAYNYFVYRVPGSDVTQHEQLVFSVTKAQIQQRPEWWLRIDGFSILDQDRFTVIFQLR